MSAAAAPLRIAVFDAKHFEVAHTAVRLFAAGGHALWVCVGQQLHGLFHEAMPGEMERHQWLVHVRPGEEKGFLDRIGAMLEAEAIDLLWITTIDNNYLKCGQMIRAHRRSRAVMTVHNLNHWFGPPPLALKLQPWRAWLSRRWLLNTMDGVCVLEEGLARTLRETYHYPKPIFVLPGLTFDDALAEPPPTDAATRFVVPGGIEAKRRNYHLVLDAFEAAAGIDPAATLTLLGGPIGEYGREILVRCERLREQGLSVRTYGGFVPQEEFHRRMKESHVVLAPIQVETSFSGAPEIYGRTKSSGTIGDIIRYGRPGVVPEVLQVAADLRGALVRYATPEAFIAQVVRLTGDRAARGEALGTARAAVGGYTPTALHARLAPELAALVARQR